MVLYFKIKIIRSEDRVKLFCIFKSTVKVTAQNKARDCSCNTCGKADEPFRVLSQDIEVYSRFAVKAFHKGCTDEMNEIFISGFVFAEKDKMSGLSVGRAFFIRHRARSHIHFTTDNRLYPRRLRRAVKVDNPVHYAVVRYGNSRLTELLCALAKPVYTAGTVEKTVFAVNMKMYKAAHFSCVSFRDKISSEIAISLFNLWLSPERPTFPPESFTSSERESSGFSVRRIAAS